MNIKKLTLRSTNYPNVLRELKGAHPTLYHMGADLNELLQRPAVTVVGSRRITPYGQQVTTQFAKELAEQGMVIISGLALGIDACAHRAALKAGGLCIAVLPCPLDKIVPARNRSLAKEILAEGGALVSEYAPGEVPQRQNFIARNRIMSGLGDATLIIEASAQSGTRHTANFANSQDKIVLAVPGNIYTPNSICTNNLIKTSKAGAVTEPTDVLHALDLKPHKSKKPKLKGSNAHQQKILDLLYAGLTDGDKILQASGLEVSLFSQCLTMLEIDGKIRPLGANHWSIY